MIEVNKRTERVLIELPNHKNYHRTAIRNAFRQTGEDVVRETSRIIRTGARTGRIYRINGRTHQASAPGEPPANLSGRLARSGGYRLSGLRLRVGEYAPYAKFLENGTRKMAPRQHLIVAINNTARNTKQYFEENALKEIKYQ